MQQFAKGQQFLDFSLEDILGGGAFAQTWKAYEPSLERHVALKLYVQKSEYRKLYGDDDPDFKEGIYLSQLPKNDFVAQVYRAGIDDDTGSRYLAQELIEGKPLSTVDFHCVRDITTLLIMLCSGLRSIHSHGLIHNDVKPDNILVNEQGYPVLIDWGSCIREGSGIENKKGSILYRAPEKFKGAATTKTDAYAVCVLGYHLLAKYLNAQGLENPLFPHQSPIPDWSNLSDDQIKEQRAKLRECKTYQDPVRLQGIPKRLWKILNKGLHRVEEKRLSVDQLQKKLYSFNHRKRTCALFTLAGIGGILLGMTYHSEAGKLFRSYMGDATVTGESFMTSKEITSSPNALSDLTVVYLSDNSIVGVDENGKTSVLLSDSLDQQDFCVNSHREVYYPYKNTVRTLDLKNNVHKELLVHRERIDSVSCSLDYLLAFQTDSQIFLYDTGRQRKELIDDYHLSPLIISPYGKYIVGVSDAGTLYVRTVAERSTRFMLLDGLDAEDSRLRWVGSESNLISYKDTDGIFRIYHLEDKKEVLRSNNSPGFEFFYTSKDNCIITYEGTTEITLDESHRDPLYLPFPYKKGSVQEVDTTFLGNGFVFTYHPSSGEDSGIYYYHPLKEKFICLTNNDVDDHHPLLLKR